MRSSKIILVFSFRTDAGVHALQSSVHVDLQKVGGGYFHPSNITIALNHHFHEKWLPIRIINTIRIPETFHCRYNAKSRTYLYRLAVIKRDTEEDFEGHHYLRYQPIEELDKCYFIKSSYFDIERLIKASKLFEGYHDFRTFMGTLPTNEKHAIPSFAKRSIDCITIEKGRPMSTSYNNEIASKIYDYWDIKIKGKSFLYRQVRRMVGCWIAYAENKINDKDIHEMLTIPSAYTWKSECVVAPPHALYLCEVEYDQEELKKAQEEVILI